MEKSPLSTLVLLIVVGLHALVIFTVTFTATTKEQREDPSIFKMVDVKEYVPPRVTPPEQSRQAAPKPDALELPRQENVAETVIETKKEVVEKDLPPAASIQSEPEYMPQHKISDPPGIPVDLIRSRIVYPPLANKQRIEGVAILELFIDKEGTIRKIDILRDPGFGLAPAAVSAFVGIRCTPAKANGSPVAVRFRYPIRFTLR
jgi:protein TonB